MIAQSEKTVEEEQMLKQVHDDCSINNSKVYNFSLLVYY